MSVADPRTSMVQRLTLLLEPSLTLITVIQTRRPHAVVQGFERAPLDNSFAYPNTLCPDFRAVSSLLSKLLAGLTVFEREPHRRLI